MAEAITFSAHCRKKANDLTISKCDEEKAVGSLREPLNEARFLHGGGHEFRRLPQHTRGLGEERSPKSDQLLSIGYGSATSDNVRLRGHLTFDMSGDRRQA